MSVRVSVVLAVAFVLGSGVFFGVLVGQPAHDQLVRVPWGHFVVVSGIALTALGLAGLTALAAIRYGDARLIALSLSFLSAAAFFSVHGLATPGFLVDAEYTAAVGFSARMALLLGAAFLALSSVDLPGRFARAVESHGRSILLGWSGVLGVYAVLALLFPASIPPRIMSEQLFLRGTLVLTSAAALLACGRYLAAYRASGLAIHGSAALAGALLLEAQIAMHFGATWRLSWWTYHAQLLGAYGAILGGVMVEVARGRGAIETLRGMTLPEALTEIEARFSPTVRALAETLEVRDPYTHGHGRRVAALAFYAAEHLGLPPREVRGIVEGALLHDLGKIGVADSVLLKGGPLNDAEFGQIRQHPAVGERLLITSLSGAVERGVVRHHHERLDGGGYPDGLEGDSIPLGARIVAVADVYDALRSNRAYRRAWTREATLELLTAESGSHFDPACVEAVLAVAERFEAEFRPEASEQRVAEGFDEHGDVLRAA
ncbi:MAG: HD domain-containing phosphohydrolase [Dehalococcoidia bacterium]